MSSTNGSGDVGRRSGSRRASRVVAGVACALAMGAAVPSPANAAVASSSDHYYHIYSTKLKCNAAGAFLVVGKAWSSWECKGFYSAGKGGYALYLYK